MQAAFAVLGLVLVFFTIESKAQSPNPSSGYSVDLNTNSSTSAKCPADDNQATIKACGELIMKDVLRALPSAGNQAHYELVERGNHYYWRGRAYLDISQPVRGVMDLTEALRLYPPDEAAFIHNAYLWRASAYKLMGKYDLSIADYTKTIELASQSTKPVARHFRGEVYLEKNDDDAAISDFSEAIREDPTWYAPYLSRSRAYIGKGDFEKSAADASAVVRMWPDFFEGYMRRGIALALKGEYALAAADLTEAIKRDPSDIFSYHFRAYVFDKQGRSDLAIVDSKKILTLKAETEAEIEFKRHAQDRLAKLAMGRRVALVIGNSQYRNVTELPNPKYDAESMAVELSRLGFEVIARYNLGVDAMRRTLAEFEEKATGADWTLVYYAGHGMEMDGKNWLIPIDAQLARSTDVPDETIALDRVLDRVHGAKKLRVVILDACRNNPFLSRMIMTGGKSRAIDRGLAKIEPEHGEVVFYAARDGSVAEDGVGGHSPFTSALLQHLDEEGVELGRFFRKVTSTVLSSTRPKQEPFVYGRLPDEDFYFKPPH